MSPKSGENSERQIATVPHQHFVITRTQPLVLYLTYLNMYIPPGGTAALKAARIIWVDISAGYS